MVCVVIEEGKHPGRACGQCSDPRTRRLWCGNGFGNEDHDVVGRLRLLRRFDRYADDCRRTVSSVWMKRLPPTIRH